MARELGDVLHYFLDEGDDALPKSERFPELGGEDGAALPVVAVPLGPRDVVRAAFVWNLPGEIARTGAAASVVAPREADTESLWPAPGVGPLGAELALCGARDLEELGSTAREVAEIRGRERSKAGLVLMCVPVDWLSGGGRLPDWTLLFTTPDARELRACYGQAERLMRQAPEARVGVTVHGVSSIEEARAAFFQLATATERNLGRGLLSYGLLLDDLHVYRAIVSLRPIGLAHPQSRGARAVGDVARLLMEDARLEGARVHG